MSTIANYALQRSSTRNEPQAADPGQFKPPESCDDYWRREGTKKKPVDRRQNLDRSCSGHSCRGMRIDQNKKRAQQVVEVKRGENVPTEIGGLLPRSLYLNVRSETMHGLWIPNLRASFPGNGAPRTNAEGRNTPNRRRQCIRSQRHKCWRLDRGAFELHTMPAQCEADQHHS